MAFRDERAAAQHRVRLAEDTLEALAKERETLEAEKRALDDAVDRAVAKKSRGRVFVLSAGALVPAFIVFLVTSGGPSCDGDDHEMLFGRVVAVEGASPVPLDARCTVFVQTAPAPSDFTGKVDVRCGNQLVYGGESLGFLYCDWARRRATRCVDTDFTEEGGDPKILFERDSAQVVITDTSPSWGLQIAIHPAPESSGGL
jgi:hypothetical protein